MNRQRHDEHLASLNVMQLVDTQRWIEQKAPGIFPSSCAVAVQRYDRAIDSLAEAADASVKNAVEKRRREFSAGRAAATAALKKIGAVKLDVPVGPGRNPLWPPGYTGSITHTAGLAIAAVARTENFSAIGIDLEQAEAVQPELWSHILIAAEIDFISHAPSAEHSRWATVFFSAKESFFKMQYPLTEEWVDFHDAEILLSGKNDGFELMCTQTSATRKLGRTHFAGHYLSGPEFSFTAMWLSAG